MTWNFPEGCKIFLGNLQHKYGISLWNIFGFENIIFIYSGDDGNFTPIIIV